MDQTFVRKRLQDVISERGLSMRQVSLAAGLNSAAVRNLITGRTQSIGMETLAKILRAIDMTEEKFFLRASAPVGTVEASAYTIPVCGEIPAGNPNYQEGLVDPVDTIPGDVRLHALVVNKGDLPAGNPTPTGGKREFPLAEARAWTTPFVAGINACF